MTTLAEATLVAHGAIGVAGLLGGGLTVSVLFAGTVPVHEPIKATLTRVCTWVVSAFWGALWGVVVGAWVSALLVRDLSVSYLHMYRADRGTGRHYPGRGKRFQRAGCHRAVTA